MAKTRRPYARDFREKMVALVRSGRSPTELSKEFEPTAQTIINWARQAERVPVRTDGSRQIGRDRRTRAGGPSPSAQE